MACEAGIVACDSAIGSCRSARRPDNDHTRENGILRRVCNAQDNLPATSTPGGRASWFEANLLIGGVAFETRFVAHMRDVTRLAKANAALRTSPNSFLEAIVF